MPERRPGELGFVGSPEHVVERGVGELAREQSCAQALCRPPSPVPATPEAARQLAGKLGVVEVAVVVREGDRLVDDRVGDLARRELLAELCLRLRPRRQRADGEEASAGTGECALDRPPARSPSARSRRRGGAR